MIWSYLVNACSYLVLLMAGLWAFRVFATGWAWKPPRIVDAVYFNLRPFYFPAAAVVTVAMISAGEAKGVNLAYLVMVWVGGFLMRRDKDDDERWKRRREKLASKVQEAGGKLVVVPVGSNA